jgi:hypothetical protein
MGGACSRNTGHRNGPSCSVQVWPEYHQLLRWIARALVVRLELTTSIEALIADVTQPESHPNMPVYHILDDLERCVDRLETKAALRGETQTVSPERVTRDAATQHTASAITREPLPASAGKRQSTDRGDRRSAPAGLAFARRRHDVGCHRGLGPVDIHG